MLTVTIPNIVSRHEDLFIKWCKINHESHNKQNSQECEVDRMVSLYDEKKATLQEVYNAVVETEGSEWEESWITFLADNFN